LQVEHPVTEMITGLDLVEWQLRVAAGEPLPFAQEDVPLDGHAIEARIYAEDPDRDFLPSIGCIAHLRAPSLSEDVRVDTGVRAGDEISRYYDPMISKLIVHGEDRATALRRLAAALVEYEVAGVATNVPFLRRVVAHSAFASGKIDTGLIARHRVELLPSPAAPGERALALAALGELARLREAAAAHAAASRDPWSPWHAIDTWWLNTDDHALELKFETDVAAYPVRVRTAGTALVLTIDGRELHARMNSEGGRLRVQLEGSSLEATVVARGEERYVFCGGELTRLRVADPLAYSGEEEQHGGHLMAPMSGTVVAVMVKPGDAVARGAPLLILEAMKMEHTIAAPAAGTVSAVNYRQGDQVAEGADLIAIDDAPTA
jgi:3-methylcrotonyl-CoA carboxylase alpha subunit